MTDNKYLLTILNQSWAVSYPLAHKHLSNVSVCCCSLHYFVVVVHLFSFVFYCETTARDSVATMWKNWLLQNNFNAHERPERTKYTRLQKSGGARTVRAYCSDDAIHITRTVRCPSRTRKTQSILWALWYSCECASTDTEEKKLLNKVVIFVFFAHKKHYRSFIKLRLNHRCHRLF